MLPPPPLFTALTQTEDRKSSPDPRANAASEAQPIDATQSLIQPAAPIPMAAAKRGSPALPDAVDEVGVYDKSFGGSSSQAKKKYRVDTTDDENSFDLKELKAVAWEADPLDALEALSNEELCRVVAAVMINFEESLPPRLPVLAKCLLSVFASTSVCGEVFEKFPEAELYEMITLMLGKEDAYSSLGAFSTRLFEWRLNWHLQSLRSV